MPQMRKSPLAQLRRNSKTNDGITTAITPDAPHACGHHMPRLASTITAGCLKQCQNGQHKPPFLPPHCLPGLHKAATTQALQARDCIAEQPTQPSLQTTSCNPQSMLRLTPCCAHACMQRTCTPCKQQQQQQLPPNMSQRM